jgi:hypothetical protein
MASSIPAAITGLLAAVSAAVDPATVSVHDGKPTGEVLGSYIAIGYDPASDTAVEFDREWAGLGAQRADEDFDILCTLVNRSGDEVISARRAGAFALLDTLTAAIATDYTLGGAVREAAVLGSGSLTQAETQKGDAAGLRFRVNCKTRINQ